jgi:hypothetical protein
MKRRNTGAVEPAPGKPAMPQRRVPGNRWVRWAANLWVLFHFAAVVLAAGSVAPTSDLVLAAWEPCRPYLQALGINQGYKFFAPEPAPTTLLRFEAERADGTVVHGRLPERPIQPRLLYHRYLLLTEHIGIAPADAQHHWYKSYARHLCHKYGATRISLTRLTHYPPSMEMVRNGTRLDDSFTYEEIFVGDFECSEL